MAYSIKTPKAKEQKTFAVEKPEFHSFKAFNQEIEKRDYQNIEGLKTEITEKDFDYFLGVLPPMKWKSGKDEGHFYMSEFLTGNLTTKFSYKVIDGKKRYFAEVVYFPKETGTTKEDWEMDYYG